MIRISKMKQPGVILIAARHNKRCIQRELGAHSRIDTSRTRNNYCLAGPATPDEVAAKAKALMAQAGVTKIRRDAVRCIELLFSLHPRSDVDHAAYFSDAVAWAAGRFGYENIISADVHLDEAAPHCHVLILPLKNGKMVGSAIVGYKTQLAEHTRDFEEKVMAVHQLHMPSRCQTQQLRGQGLFKVVCALQNCKVNLLDSAVGPLLREAIFLDPYPWMHALGLAPPRRTILKKIQ